MIRLREKNTKTKKGFQIVKKIIKKYINNSLDATDKA